MRLKSAIAAITLLGLGGILLMSYVTFSGSPRWPLSGGYHYVVSLRPASFPVGSDPDNYAQYAMSDLRDIGDTNFTPGYNRNNTSYTNHSDGRNAWARLYLSGESYLGVTFVRWSGSTMKDCDIWYNTRHSWTYGITDPNREPARAVPPYAFRNTARHETLHAIGFDHEDRTLSNVNHTYTDGRGVPHVSGSGLMPQATDKHGVRVLYPASQTVRNLHSGRWREPASGSGSARRLSTSGTWAAGTSRSVAFWLSNQSNVAITGGSGSSGVRVGIYLSTNSTISTGDQKLAQYNFTGDWPAHAAGYYSLSASMPANQCPGTYYVGVIFDNLGIVSEQWESDNASLVGMVTVTNNIRTLTVRSVNPSSGVNIAVSRADRNGRQNGTTEFAREYCGNTSVSLTAPSSTSSGRFRRWVIDGVGRTMGSRTQTASLTKNMVAIAEYYRYTAGTFTVFGTGCPSYRPTLAGLGTPDIGNLVSYRVSGAPARTGGLLYLGFSRTVWGPFRLPLPLAGAGMNGCYLDVSIDVTSAVATDSSGTWTGSLRIPNSTSLIGAHLYTQAGVIDRRVPWSLKYTHTRALDTRVGGERYP